jgi:hypothetical protein
MGKFNFEEYRDNLADDLKSFRSERTEGRSKGDEGRETAKKVLKKEKDSIRYKKAEELHDKYVEKLMAIEDPFERRLKTGNEEGAEEMYDEILDEFKSNLENTLSSGKMLELENLQILLSKAGIDDIKAETPEDVDKIDWRSLLKKTLGAYEVDPKDNDRDARKWSWYPNSDRKEDGMKSFDSAFVPKDLDFEFKKERIQKMLQTVKETNNGTEIAPLLNDGEGAKQILLGVVSEKIMGKVELSKYQKIHEVFAGLDDKIYYNIGHEILGEDGRKWVIPNGERHIYVEGVIPEGFPIIRYEGSSLKYHNEERDNSPLGFHKRFLMIGDQVLETSSRSCAGGIKINSNEKGETESITLGKGNDGQYEGKILFKDYDVPVLEQVAERSGWADAPLYQTLPGIENGGKPSFSFKYVYGSADYIKKDVEDAVKGDLTVRQLEEIKADPEKLKKMEQEIENKFQEKKKEEIKRALDKSATVEAEMIE